LTIRDTMPLVASQCAGRHGCVAADQTGGRNVILSGRVRLCRRAGFREIF
jgi:hypothetical protein